ncbi:hypothetical protein [Mycolicibacterium holsaticum]|uniref:hypothetical protein n=1 Tax=Mycolicibacterium holsaticum TaxID=152142 RepID=UPI00223CC3AA
MRAGHQAVVEDIPVADGLGEGVLDRRSFGQGCGQRVDGCGRRWWRRGEGVDRRGGGGASGRGAASASTGAGAGGGGGAKGSTGGGGGGASGRGAASASTGAGAGGGGGAKGSTGGVAAVPPAGVRPACRPGPTREAPEAVAVAVAVGLRAGVRPAAPAVAAARTDRSAAEAAARR